MTNCKCGSMLRKGEKECDRCLLKKFELEPMVIWNTWDYSDQAREKMVAKALRKAEEKGYMDALAEWKESDALDEKLENAAL